MTSLDRKAHMIADMSARNNSNADYEFELKIAYAILAALGVTE